MERICHYATINVGRNNMHAANIYVERATKRAANIYVERARVYKHHHQDI